MLIHYYIHLFICTFVDQSTDIDIEAWHGSVHDLGTLNLMVSSERGSRRLRTMPFGYEQSDAVCVDMNTTIISALLNTAVLNTLWLTSVFCVPISFVLGFSRGPHRAPRWIPMCWGMISTGFFILKLSFWSWDRPSLCECWVLLEAKKLHWWLNGSSTWTFVRSISLCILDPLIGTNRRLVHNLAIHFAIGREQKTNLWWRTEDPGYSGASKTCTDWVPFPRDVARWDSMAVKAHHVAGHRDGIIMVMNQPTSQSKCQLI